MPVLLVWVGLQHHEEEISWFSWIQRLVTVPWHYRVVSRQHGADHAPNRPVLFLPLQPRVMKGYHAVQLCTCCHSPSVGWRFFLQATETCPNPENFHQSSGLEECWDCSSSHGFGPTLTTTTKLCASWPAILTKLSAGLTANLCRTSNLF